MKKMLLGYVKHCQDNFLSQNVEASGTVSEMLKYSYGQNDNVHGSANLHEMLVICMPIRKKQCLIQLA